MRFFAHSGRRRVHGARRAGRVLPRAQAGFSLVELLVILGVVIVLTTMYWGGASPSRQRRDRKVCQQNLQKIYVALQIFANDFGGTFPETNAAQTAEEALDALVPRYTADTAIFICPGGKDPPLPEGETFRHRKISYAYYMGRHRNDTPAPLMSDRQVDTKPRSAGDCVFSSTGKPPGNNHHKYGGNFLFSDGHLESSPPRIPFPVPAAPGVVLLNPRP